MSFDIELIKRKMLVKYPFFGNIVVNVDYKLDTNIKTAATDGNIIYFNPIFLEELSIEQQIFVFAHEVCHIAFNHIIRSDEKNYYIWNVATDAVINAFLKKDGLEFVDGVIDIADAINYDAEELYKKLLNEKDEYHKNIFGFLGEINNINNIGHDSHSMWEEAVKKHKEETKKENRKEKIYDVSEKDAFKKNLEEKKKELQKLKKILSQQAIGNDSSKNRIVTDIGRMKPLIDWRYALRVAINYEVDWSYNNSTIEDGVISANLEEQLIPETEIILDTSGSVNETLLKNFLRECKNILRYSKLKVGCFDTNFYGFHEIRNDADIDNMKFEGGGGTDFDVAVRAFSKRVENKIIFTDGNADMPSIPLDVIWIVFGSKKINPKCGKVIEINDKQLNNLYSQQQLDLYKRRSR